MSRSSYTSFFQRNPDFFYDAGEPILDKSILKNKYPFKLPDEFLDFYSIVNGGNAHSAYVEYTPQASVQMSTQESSLLSIEKFYSLAISESQENAFFFTEMEPNQYPLALEGQTDILDLDEMKKKYQDYLIFASNNGGSNLWLLGIVEHNFGQIFYWSEDENEEYNPHLVSQNFDNFIHSLIIED